MWLKIRPLSKRSQGSRPPANLSRLRGSHSIYHRLRPSSRFARGGFLPPVRSNRRAAALESQFDDCGCVHCKNRRTPEAMISHNPRIAPKWLHAPSQRLAQCSLETTAFHAVRRAWGISAATLPIRSMRVHSSRALAVRNARQNQTHRRAHGDVCFAHAFK